MNLRILSSLTLKIAGAINWFEMNYREILGKQKCNSAVEV